jgi:hypothetical protein
MPHREVFIRFVKVELQYGGYAGPIGLEEGEVIKRIERFGRFLIIQVETPLPPPRQELQPVFDEEPPRRVPWWKKRAG